jgi:uncharacterized protein YjbI with pentapeptide repeats
LSGVDLSATILIDINLSGADLSGVDLSSTTLIDINLSGADLSGADLSGADLSGADLSSANLSGADLSGANLDWVNLTGTIIDGHTKLDHKWYFIWQLVNSKLKPECYQLSLFDFSDSFQYNHYVGQDLNSTCLNNCQITDLNLSFSMFYRCDCQNTNFTNTNLYGSNFHSANLSGANLSGTDLRCAVLIGANLKGADLSYADLRYANLHGVDLTYTNTEGAKFSMFEDISCSWNQIDDEEFEKLCYDILKEKHKPIEINKIGKSCSRDGGRDIVFYKLRNKAIDKNPVKWITQCKLIRNGNSLTGKKVENIRDMLDHYDAGGFCIMTSAVIDSTLHDKLDKLKDKNGFEVERWSYLEIERFLAEHPEIRSRYFK